jgi:FG-GAP-like repeat
LRKGAFAGAATYEVGDPSISVAVGDLDGDGVMDLAMANQWTSTMSILLGTGNDAFASTSPYAAGFLPLCVVSGDLDGAGVVDLATANSGNNTASVLLGLGNGALTSAVPRAVDSEPFRLPSGTSTVMESRTSPRPTPGTTP